MPRRCQLAFAGAGAAAVAAALAWIAAVHVGPVQRADGRTLAGFTALDGPRMQELARALAQLCDPLPFAWLAAALVAAALARRRPRTAVAVGVALGGANVTTQLLKPALATPRSAPPLADADQVVVAAASWPSGHATAAMALALGLVLVAPARARPWAAAAGGLFAVAVTFSFLSLGWHFPSDVLGGFLVAASWALAAVGALWWSERRWPRRAPGAPPPAVGAALAPTGAAAAAALLLAGAVLLARPAQVVGFAQQHTTFVVGAGLLGAAALGLAAALTVLVARVARR